MAYGGTAPTGAATRRFLLLLNNILAMVSNGAWYVIGPFVPLYLGTLGASVSVVGLVLGVSGVLPLLIAIPSGALADKHGAAAVAKAAVVAYALAAVALLAIHNVWAVAIAYALLGAGSIGFAVEAQAVVAAISPPRERLNNFGYYSLWSSAGAVVGPPIGGAIVGHLGYTAAFALIGMLMVPSFAIANVLSAVPPTARSVVSLASAYDLVVPILRRPGIGAVLFISFMTMAAQTLQQSFYPIYLSSVGLSVTLIGTVFAAISLSSMLVRSLLSPGTARLGNTGLLLAATGLAALSLGITPFLREFWPLAAAGALMGASTGLALPMTMNLMTEPVPAEYWGVAFGIRQGVMRVAMIISPVVFGVLIAAAGLPAGFFAGALTLVGAMPIIAKGITSPGRPRMS